MALEISLCYLKFLWQTLQRLADSWLSSIGSTAISVVIAYFESQEDDSDDSHAEFSQYALDKLRFCYKKSDGEDEGYVAPFIYE